MSDGRIDGHFVIISDLSTGIRDELGLTTDDCNKMGSVWEQVLEEATNTSNYEINTQNSDMQTGTVIKFTKECWSKIVDIINKALITFSEKQIQIDDADTFHDNINLGESAILKYNQEYSDKESDTLLYQIYTYVNEYKNNDKKLEELKSTPQFQVLADYILKYSDDKELDELYTKFEKLNKISLEEDEIILTLPSEAELQVHNCSTRANITAEILQQQGINVSVIEISDKSNNPAFVGSHSFCVIGMDKDADINNPSTWGKEAVIVDAWIGKTFSVEDGINFYKEFFIFNDTESRLHAYKR